MAIDTSTTRAIYTGIAPHVGHTIVAVAYAGGVNMAIECEDCGAVLLDADAPELEEQGDTGVAGEAQGDTGVQGDTPPSPTIQQVLESAYHNSGDLLGPGMLYTWAELEKGVGDGLLEFLLREIVFDGAGTGPHTTYHWEQARWRMDQIVGEVTRVRDALYRHSPD